MRMTIGDMAACIGASILHESALKNNAQTVNGVRIDHRAVKPGDVFVCIPGKRTDGHIYAAAAAEAGAIAIIAERDPFKNITPPAPVIATAGSVQALGRLAMCHRDMTYARVLGITGTAGKTSVKEVLAAVLGVRGRTSRNLSNMNNQIGLPVSMLNADLDDMFWVMEAGISSAHDMDELGEILAPDLALILNVGLGHFSGLGDRGVAYYKARFLAHLSQDGVAVVSADYPDLAHECAQHGRSVVYFSTRRTDVDYSASYMGPASASTGRYTVSIRGRAYEMVAPFRGAFGSENVAAIVAAAHMVGLSPDEIALGLAGAALPPQRFCCSTASFEGGCEWMVIDDSYNANPLSTSRMLETAAEMSREGARELILVMGEMLELGSAAEKAHHEIGALMSPASLVLWKGGHGEAIKEGLKEAEYKGEFLPFGTVDEFLRAIEPKKKQGGVILFKGSRGNRLDEMAEAFKKAATAK